MLYYKRSPPNLLTSLQFTCVCLRTCYIRTNRINSKCVLTELGVLPPVNENIEKLEKIVNVGNYYGAQQMYKSVSARYIQPPQIGIYLLKGVPKPWISLNQVHASS